MAFPPTPVSHLIPLAQRHSVPSGDNPRLAHAVAWSQREMAFEARIKPASGIRSQPCWPAPSGGHVRVDSFVVDS